LAFSNGIAGNKLVLIRLTHADLTESDFCRNA